MFKFTFLLFLTGIRFSNGNQPGQENNGMFDIQEALSAVCKTAIDFDSCLMSTFVPLYNTTFGFSEFDFDTCTPPQFLETDLISVFEQSKTICNGRGFDVDDESVQYHVNALLSSFATDGCLSEACNSSKHKSVFPDVKKILFETIGSCSGVEIDPNTCLADFSLDQILGGAMGGAEGLRARRVLLQSTDAFSQTDFELPSLCKTPLIDEEVINNIVQVGNSICGYTAEDASILSDALTTMFSAEGCFMNLCKAVEAQGMKLVSSLFESVGQCTGTVQNPNSCVLTTAIEMLLFSPEGGEGGAHARRLLEQRSSFQVMALGALEDIRAICYPPTIDSEIISNLIDGAAVVCVEKGEIIDLEDIQNMTETIHSLFSTDSCWTNFCSDALNDINDVIDWQWNIPELATEKVLECANVQINFDSCVERDIHKNMLNGVTDRNLKESIVQPNNKLRRKRTDSVIELAHATFRRTEYEESEMCLIPRLQLLEKEIYFAPLIESCNPTVNEIDVAWNKLQMLVESDICWESVCGEFASTLFLFQSVEKCLNFALPVIHELESNPVLLCMLEYATRVKMNDINDVEYCPDVLAPDAIKHCVGIIPETGGPEYSMSFSYEYMYEDLSSYFYELENGDEKSLSYSYEQTEELSDELMNEINQFFNSMGFTESHPKSISYSYNYEYSYSYEYEDEHEGDTLSILSDQLCFLVEEMKSGKAQECLSSMLSSIQGFNGFNGLKSITSVPSVAPSLLMPPSSDQPYPTESNVPSNSPSKSFAPSVGPSLLPTRVVLAENPKYDDDDEVSSASSKYYITYAIYILTAVLYVL